MGSIDFRKRIKSVFSTKKKQQSRQAVAEGVSHEINEQSESQNERKLEDLIRKSLNEEARRAKVVAAHTVQYGDRNEVRVVEKSLNNEHEFSAPKFYLSDRVLKNEYIQKSVLTEYQRNIDINTPIRFFVNATKATTRREEERVKGSDSDKKRQIIESLDKKFSRSRSPSFVQYGSAKKYAKIDRTEFGNTLKSDRFERAAFAGAKNYSTASIPGFGRSPALTYDNNSYQSGKRERDHRQYGAESWRKVIPTPLELVKKASFNREEIEKALESEFVDLTNEEESAEEEEIIDLTNECAQTPDAPDFLLRRTKSATASGGRKMGAAPSSSGGNHHSLKKAKSVEIDGKKRRNRRIDIFGKTAREVVANASEGDQLSVYKAQIAQYTSVREKDDKKDEEDELAAQRNLQLENHDDDDDGDVKNVEQEETPRGTAVTTTVTKMGGTHTKFRNSPLLTPIERKVDASARSAKREIGFTTTSTTNEQGARKTRDDDLEKQLQRLRLEQQKKQELRAKATQERIEAEKEAAKEPISVVSVPAIVVDVFDQTLNDEEDEKVDEAYDCRESAHIACAKLPGQGLMPLKGKDIHTLAPVTWLNDEIVNFMLGMLARRQRELCGPEGQPGVHFFNTFFLNKLFQDDEVYDYNKVRRWSTEKKCGYLPIKCDKIIIPVHQGVHWVLAVIDIKKKVVSYYDSLLGRDRKVVQNLIRYVIDESEDKLKEKWARDEWKEEFPSKIPRQMNGSDCGMFMLSYARCIAADYPEFTFDQSDMVNLRRRLLMEILNIGLEQPIDD